MEIHEFLYQILKITIKLCIGIFNWKDGKGSLISSPPSACPSAYFSTDRIIPPPCSNTLHGSSVCMKSNPDSWVWYSQDWKMWLLRIFLTACLATSLIILYSRCPGYLHVLSFLHFCFLNLCSHCFLPPFHRHWLFEFQLRHLLFKKALLDLPHSEAEPALPYGCF